MSLAGVWSHGPVDLGSVRSLLDESAPPHWPRRMTAVDDGRLVLTDAALARPPRRAELAAHRSGARLCGDVALHERETLAELLGIHPADHDDAELVLEAYARYGLDMPARLIGDFGFALWDPARRRLLLVRDPGGARPLFYTTRQARLAFSSRSRSLRQISGTTALDERAVLDYLAELPQEEEATLYAGVRRLPPGCCLVVDDVQLRVAPYLDITQTPELRLASDAEYAEALRETLGLAVACRARGSLGVMLSGGLDSSAMAALAATTLPRAGGITTLSAVFPEFEECDERPFQAAVAGRVGSRHIEVRPDPSGPAGDLASLRRVFSEPSFVGPHWLAWSVAEAARRSGVSTMFSGIDGDRVVSHGAGRYADLARARDFRGLAAELLAVDDFGWSRRLRVGLGQALLGNLPEDVVSWLEVFDPRQLGRFEPRLRLMRPALLRRYEVRERLRALPLRPRSGRDDHARSLLASDRNWDVELLDQLGAAFDIEFVQPFFDRRVMELCFSFPSSQKRRDGWSRFVLRQALRGLVPAEVLERRRDASFDRPYESWVKAWLRAHAPDAAGHLEPIAEYVDVQPVAKMLSDIQAFGSGWAVDFAWRCVILSLWLAPTE
jgi:asparagine synthase (glutamine-hydrolysing)